MAEPAELTKMGTKMSINAKRSRGGSKKEDLHMNYVEDQNVSTEKDHATMVGSIRGVVSKKKRRFIKDGFDLDLTYVTKRLIAMGFPAENYEQLYRNSMEETTKFFQAYHKDHYWIYNLCSERSYDEAKFQNRVIRFGFDDHNCPIFESMKQLCEHLDEWLSRHPKNIASLHCKAGKGRTGLMICVYLIHTGFESDAENAMSFYGMSRTTNLKGVTIPSQRRWVNYYAQHMQRMIDGSLLTHKNKPLKITKIFISSASPKWSRVVVYNDQSIYETYKGQEFFEKREIMVAPDTKKNPAVISSENWKKTTERDGTTIVVPGIEVYKDVKVQFEVSEYFGLKFSRAWSFWFNTDFIDPRVPLKLSKKELDKVNKEKKTKDFHIFVYFEEAEQAETPRLKTHLTSKLFPGSCDSLPSSVGMEALTNASVDDELLVVLGILMQGNIEIRNRVWKNRAYKHSFVGAEAALWLREFGFNETEDVVAIAQRMLRNKFFKHIPMEGKDLDPNMFLNTFQFYRFNTSPHMAS